MKIVALLLGMILTLPLSLVIMVNLFGGSDEDVRPKDKKGCVWLVILFIIGLILLGYSGYYFEGRDSIPIRRP